MLTVWHVEQEIVSKMLMAIFTQNNKHLPDHVWRLFLIPAGLIVM